MSGLDVLERRYLPPPGGPDAAPVSRDGTVRPLVDGVDYFTAIKAEVDRLGPGDSWYVAGWLLGTDFRFGPGGPTLDVLLAGKAAAGVDVRVVVWASRTLLGMRILPPGLAAFRNYCVANVRSAERLRAFLPVAGNPPLADRVLLDWSGNATSSHHMKLTVLVRGDVVTAFAGGMDYWPDRFDAMPHTSMPQRAADGRPVPWGWHDAGVVVTGAPAHQVLATFRTRWTEAATLSPATYDVGAGPRPFNPPRPAALPAPPVRRPAMGPPAPASATSPPRTGIQVVRSWPATKEPGNPPVPWRTLPAGGVHEVRQTLLRAIGAARRYVYVEDQAFDAAGTLFPELAAACRRGVKVIALLPGTTDPNDGALTPANGQLGAAVQTALLGGLRPAEQENLAVWRLDGVTVHAKVVLVDDAFLCVGSANAMDRSLQATLFGDDSELSVAAVSTTSLVADLRVRLWAEHLRVGTARALAEIRNLDASLGFWRPGWGRGLREPQPASPLAFVGPVAARAPARQAPAPARARQREEALAAG